MPNCPSCGVPLPEGSNACPRCNASTQAVHTPFPAIKGYEPVRPLGEGGMGAVYLATDQMLHRKVAIKVVSRRIAAEGEAGARFLREARSLAQVEHAHIVRVYSFGDVEGQPYLVMEYVEGEDLGHRLARDGRMAVAEALRIARQVAEALEAAWEQRVVHRDIKPSNILLDKRNQVRVADFGLAKPMQSEAVTPLTKSYVLGTPHYASPEQVRGLPLDFRSDIYSLGIVLYEMLVGERPFEGSTAFDILTRQVHEPLPLVTEKRADVPGAVAQLVAWMTQKDPERRPVSYRDLIASLATAVEDGTVRLTPAEAFTPTAAELTTPLTPADYVQALTPAPDLARSSRRGLWMGVAASALILILAGIGWFAWKSFQKPPPAVASRRLVVAVAPFYGPDEDSIKEGRVMAALVERAVTQRLGKYDVKVLGVEETKEPVRDADAARALGEKLGATMVVWGEAFALRGETEIQPYFTLVPAKSPSSKTEQAGGRLGLGPKPLTELQERAGAMKVEAAAPNQIELRKTSAAGAGDLVLLLAGVHALYNEQDVPKALEFFRAAPPTSESLRYQAEAYHRRKETDRAREAIIEAIKLDPRSAPAHAFLGDLMMEAGLQTAAAMEYRSASEVGGAYDTREAIWYDGKLYLKEKLTDGDEFSSGYMLALDPLSGKVVERYRLPEPPARYAATPEGFRIAYQYGDGQEASIGFAKGKFDRPVFYGAQILRRRDSWRAGERLARNLLNELGTIRSEGGEKLPQTGKGVVKDLPNTARDLEWEERDAFDRDPTQPWHLFFLGQALWTQGKQDDAEKEWEKLFAGAFSGTPYFEYSRMAWYFERFDQRAWADRAYAEALKRRQQIPQPVGAASLTDRLVNASFVNVAAKHSQAGRDIERAYQWLERARELTGPEVDGDYLAARAWEKYFRRLGDSTKADQEARYAERARGLLAERTSMVVRLDMALYALITAVLSFLLLAVLLVARAAIRCERRQPDGRWWRLAPTVARGAAALVIFAIGGLYLVVGIMAVLEHVNQDDLVAGPVVAAFGVAAILALVFHRRLRLPVSSLLAIAVSGALMVLGGVGVWVGSTREGLVFGLTLLAMGLAVAALFGFRRRLGLTLDRIEQGIPWPSSLVRAISVQERWALAVSALVVLSAFVLVQVTSYRTMVNFNLPDGLSDSMGGAAFVAKTEAWLKDYDTPLRRYVAAVANHMAGETERARELYESLPENPNAQENLSVLRAGEGPSKSLTLDDVCAAALEAPMSFWWKTLPNPIQLGELFTAAISLSDALGTGGIGRAVALVGVAVAGRVAPFGVLAAMILLPALLLLAWLLPPQPSENDSTLPSAPLWARVRRTWMTLLPGAYDIRQGNVWMGYAFLTLAAFLLYLTLVQLVLGPMAGLPGLVSAIALPGLENAYPMPPPGDVGMWQSHYGGRFFWDFPYVVVFWPFAGLCALAVLAYHATRLRRIWQS